MLTSVPLGLVGAVPSCLCGTAGNRDARMYAVVLCLSRQTSQSSSGPLLQIVLGDASLSPDAPLLHRTTLAQTRQAQVETQQGLQTQHSSKHSSSTVSITVAGPPVLADTQLCHSLSLSKMTSPEPPQSTSTLACARFYLMALSRIGQVCQLEMTILWHIGFVLRHEKDLQARSLFLL